MIEKPLEEVTNAPTSSAASQPSRHKKSSSISRSSSICTTKPTTTLSSIPSPIPAYVPPTPVLTKQLTAIALETPLPSRLGSNLDFGFHQASAMKGVILTTTGQILATPNPLAPLNAGVKFPDFKEFKVTLDDGARKNGLGYGKVFDFDEDTTDEEGPVSGDEQVEASPFSEEEEEIGEEFEQGFEEFLEDQGGQDQEAETETEDDEYGEATQRLGRVEDVSPSMRKHRSLSRTSRSSGNSNSTSDPSTSSRNGDKKKVSLVGVRGTSVTGAPPTRLRKPSIRRSSRTELPLAHSESASSARETRTRRQATTTAPPGPKRAVTVPLMQQATVPPSPAVYDFDDEENLPSPFLRKIEREPIPPPSLSSTGVVKSVSNSVSQVSNAAGAGKKRTSLGANLRMMATTNAARAAIASTVSSGATGVRDEREGRVKTSLSRRVGEDLKRTFIRA